MSYIRWGEGTPHYMYQTRDRCFVCLHCANDAEFSFTSYREAICHLWRGRIGLAEIAPLVRATGYLLRDWKMGE